MASPSLNDRFFRKTGHKHDQQQRDERTDQSMHDCHLETDEWQQCIELIEPHFGYFFLRRRVPGSPLLTPTRMGVPTAPNETACFE